MNSRLFSTHKTISSNGIYPFGFKLNAISTLVKKNNALDLTIIHSQTPCVASAVFTKNSFAAAPVQLSKTLLEMSQNSGLGIHAVVINSGCANACTGDKGLADAKEMIQTVDSCMKHTASHPQTVVMSTGVIGQNLQMDKITSGISQLVKDLGDSHQHWINAATGIMTTDTFPKLSSKEYTFSNRNYRIAGICKGAGMIHPNMATMLASIFTDVVITKECLDSAVKHAIDRSFNSISVDGDTSTNDTCLVLANGASKCQQISDLKSPEYLDFCNNLTEFCMNLAQLIVRDGEGATKFIDVHVKGAKTFADAKKVASCIATSPLVKTALYGKDANWGRIVCAVGYSGVFVLPDKVNLYFSSNEDDAPLHLFKNGVPFDCNEEKAAKILENTDINITVDLGLGENEAHVYTCDLSHEYVDINADYRS